MRPHRSSPPVHRPLVFSFSSSYPPYRQPVSLQKLTCKYQTLPKRFPGVATLIPQSYTLSAYSYLLLYRLREGLCNKKARFQESRFFEYSIAHLTLIAARKRHNARDVPSALPIHFLLYQMNASAYFNRRSPRGERLAQQQCCCETNRFQSTLPVGGATLTSTAIS